MMNNKGFTLVELLVTIILVGVLGAIAYTTVINVYDASKKKNEDIFIGRLSNVIDDYIALYHDDYNYSYYKESVKETGTVSVSRSDLVSLDKLGEKKLVNLPIINPRNKNTCDGDFYIYKDSDYVFCFSIILDCLEKDDKLVTNCQFEVD